MADNHIYTELNLPLNGVYSNINSPTFVLQEETKVRRVKPNIWLMVSAVFITAIVSVGLTYSIGFLMNTTKSSDMIRLNNTCTLNKCPLNSTHYSKNVTSSNKCKYCENIFKNNNALSISSKCPENWYAYYSGCYLKVKERKTWFKAQEFCRSNRSDLLSIHSRDELIAITRSDLFDDNYYWIGLHDHDKDDNFEWSDGTPLDYTNWHPYEPNRWNGVENCVVLYEDNSWNDANCYLPFYFVCKTVITTRCGTGDWIYFNSSCYMFNTRVVTWDEARLSCKSQGADLAVIPTQHELDFLLSQMFTSSYSKFPVWVGLRRQGNGEFGWIDGTVDNSFPWSMPVQSFSCVGVDRYGNFFSTMCKDQSGFICEKVL